MSLRTKVGIVFGIMVVLMVVHGGYSIARQRSIMEEENRERAGVLVGTLSEMALDSLVARHFDRLERQVDSMLTHADVRFARVIDGAGRIVADTRRERQGWVLTRSNRLAGYRQVGADVTIDAPIILTADGQQRRIGTVELGMSLLRVRERSLRTTLVLLLVLLVQIAVGVVFGVYLQVQVVRPLAAVAHGVESLLPGQDNASIPAPRRAAREIRTVSLAINGMRSRLEHYYREEREQQRLRTLGEISVSLAHEIRNPLEAVGGAVEVLRTMTGAGEKRDQFYDIITEEVTNLNRYVSEFLRYGRFDIPDEEPWDLRALADDAVLLVSPLCMQRQIRLEVYHSEEPIPVTVSADQIKRVLVNLLMNAIEACSFGDEVSVYTEVSGTNGGIRIEDNGPGVDQTVAHHLFDPFVTTKDRGAGLGLAICRTIVDHHQGSISVGNRDVGGVCASVVIPLTGRASDGT